jgi:hypothetical protein
MKIVVIRQLGVPFSNNETAVLLATGVTPHRPHQGLIVFPPVKNWGSRSGGHRPLDPPGRWASRAKQAA